MRHPVIIMKMIAIPRGFAFPLSLINTNPVRPTESVPAQWDLSLTMLDLPSFRSIPDKTLPGLAQSLADTPQTSVTVTETH